MKNTRKTRKIQSTETKYLARREELMRSLENLDRRAFLRVSGAVAAGAAVNGVALAHSFQPVRVEGKLAPFRFAYISDSHLYEKKVNDRFLRSLLRARQCEIRRVRARDHEHEPRAEP